MKRFLCLYLPRWPLQRLCAAQPDVRGKAAALFERSAHGPRLAVCSVEANKRGVKRGMLLADATALAPELALYEVDCRADREALEKLALWASRFSPLVGLESPAPSPPILLSRGERGTAQPQALLVDITGCAQVFRGEQNLLRQALEGLARKGCKARAAIAPTIGAAWALAHYGANGEVLTAETQRRREGIEQEQEGPLCLCASVVESVLAALPLPALRLEPEAVAWLNQLGLHRIGDVLNQPRSALPSRFGAQLLERIDQALGMAPEVLPLLRPAPEFQAASAFDYLLKDLEWLARVMEQLVSQIAAALQQRCRGAREIECWLYHEVGEPLCAAVTLHKASASAKHLLQLLQTQLENMRNRVQSGTGSIANRKSEIENLQPEDGVRAVAVRVMASEPLDAEQLALFHQAVRTPENLALTLDRLSTRLGREAVVRPHVVDDPQPEDAVEWVGVGEAPPPHPAFADAHVGPLPQGEREARGSRPLALLPQPEPIGVFWPRHSLWPLRFEWRGRPHIIREAWGPERIETGWWKERYVRRDYYVVATTRGECYWIFQRRDDGQWFLHGVFS